MPTFKEKSEVDNTRVKSRDYGDLGLKSRWNFRFSICPIRIFLIKPPVCMADVKLAETIFIGRIKLYEHDP